LIIERTLNGLDLAADTSYAGRSLVLSRMVCAIRCDYKVVAAPVPTEPLAWRTGPLVVHYTPLTIKF
jgi:hypothetical protein